MHTKKMIFSLAISGLISVSGIAQNQRETPTQKATQATKEQQAPPLQAVTPQPEVIETVPAQQPHQPAANHELHAIPDPNNPAGATVPQERLKPANRKQNKPNKKAETAPAAESKK